VEGDNMKLRMTLLAGASVMGLASGLISTAHADYAFSGSGASGTFTGQASELFNFNYDGGASSALGLNDWGSPGVSAGITPYNEAQPAFGFDITFTGGGTIDPGSITTGNGAGCVGSTYGGTTFCTEGSAIDIWQAILVSPDTIDFLAQSSTFFITTGENYFVNIFFDGATPTAFTGAWLTSFSPTPTPLPAALPLFAGGLGLMGLVSRLRKRKNSAALAAA
jgi:hypothetical protein